MIIIPTRVCNTNFCEYCGVLKKDFEFNYFSSDFDMQDFYEKILHIAQKENDFELRFFGGEAFLKFEKIKEIIIFFKEKNNNFKFTINTNLSIIDDKKIEFIKENNIKLIISCNGDLNSHSKTRGISINETIKLYKNIKKILKNNIDHQINIVVTPKTVNKLNKNFKLLDSFLNAKNINLLPVSYNGWDGKSLDIFEKELEKTRIDLENKNINLNFINKNIENDVSLFNSEITIDSDGKIYPSMVIIESFFEKEKDNIIITDINKNIDNLKEDLNYYETENHKIYDLYINKVLRNKFKDIIENDDKSSIIFGEFLKKI